MSYARFAVYYLPPDGAFAQAGASWLGWDAGRGVSARQPDLPGLHDVTMTPRKYGFHGTLKPPFRLADGMTEDGLRAAMAVLARQVAPARCDGLGLHRIGGFLALTPQGDTAALAEVAAACVTQLDDFRAPAREAELARRRAGGLSARQDALLTRWGYPYVLEEFRFHLTLTGRLDDLAPWEDAARAHFPPLPAPFVVDQIALVGERPDGCFQLIQRYALTG
ncbi:DUF1045 domain-containing protein [Loktanella agnita]|uniref:DUF1045 domain-containing protein n=1 Tax=Loktanella agnita TaxID=287097 RepID=UPI003986164E